MKFPIIFRVFASLNLLAFIFLLFQSIILYYAPIITFDIVAMSTAATLWSLLVAFYWFFASNKSYAFLYLTAIMFLMLAGYTLYTGYIFLPTNTRNQGFIFIIAYAVIVIIYSSFMIGSLFFKPVIEWKKSIGGSTQQPIILFILVMGFSFTLLLVINKYNSKYIIIESTNTAYLNNGHTAIIDFDHLSEIDGLAISKNDLQESFKAVVSYSTNWEASSQEDYFRTDTILFKTQKDFVRSGEHLPYVSSSDTPYLFSHLPKIKVRRIKIESIDNVSIQDFQYTFSPLHSVAHFGNKDIATNYIALDDQKPVTGYAEIHEVEAEANESFNALIDIQRNDLITSFFDKLFDNYSNTKYNFNSENARIVLNGKPFGYYDSFHYLFGQYGAAILGVEGNQYDNESTYFNDLNKAVYELTGVTLYTENQNLPFHSLNPQFVKWLPEYMIPSPDDQFYDYTARQIYQATFRRMIWMMIASYEYLDNAGDNYFQAEADSYLTATQTEGFQGPTYLYNQYSSIDVESTAFQKLNIINPEKSNDYFYFDKEVAIGFWLRREMDGSRAQVWEFLKEIVNTYDDYPFSETESMEDN